jgi:hypothetical protein
LGKFAALYPQYNCDETATYRICLLLHQAEELVGGIVSGPKREMAIMFAVLHMLETQNNAMLRAQAQSTAIAFGEAPQISAPGSSGWWGLTEWGLMVEQLLSVNDRVSFVMI